MVAKRLAGWRRWLPPVISAVLVTALIAALLRPGRSGIAGSPLLDKPAPASTLRSLDGVKVELASLQGRPVVVNFWASWCLPCRDEAPLLRSLSETQSDRGLAVLGISFQEPELQNARAFIREYALAYPSLIDPGARTAINYGVKVRLKNVLAQVFPGASSVHGRGRRWGAHAASCVPKRFNQSRLQRPFSSSSAAFHQGNRGAQPVRDHWRCTSGSREGAPS
ncbi:hypothetical protein GCM10010842_39340 [Deinococcus daejeonensis]|uniref:Thioredoxin domain-containing protein n=1 Tax=Deinococcus daejeonensis TaxID=1007098 RepID=A0ABQ2JKD6_9DEIO|nr:hypothetical protein GCM10010842_39340 [Deinococcus daejeonensis]